MSIVFILILISALSSYIIIVNDQVVHSYDIVVQIEKSLKSFYETEFVIYYVLDFYQKNCKEINLPYKKNFDLCFSPAQKKINFSVELDEYGKDVAILITIFKSDLRKVETVVNCHLYRENDCLIKLKNYQIEKRRD